MRKSIFNKVKLVSFAFAVSIVGASASIAQTWEVSLSTPVPPTSYQAVELEQFAADVLEQTDGEMKVNIFYSNSLGSQSDMLLALAANELEMNLSGHFTVPMYAPEFGFLTVPFLIKDSAHMQKLLDSEIYSRFKDKLEDNGIVVVSPYISGTRHLFSNREIDTVDELEGLTIRVPNSRTFIEGWSGVGASPQTVAFQETYAALQTGLVEATEGPYRISRTINLSEVVDNIYSTSHQVEIGALYFSKEWLDSLPADVAEVVRETGAEAAARMTERNAANDQVDLDTAIELGMNVVEIDTTAMIEKIRPKWQALFDSEWTAATYEEILNYAD